MDFKLKNPGKTGLPKDCSPKLLTLLLKEMEENAGKCLVSGFRKSGIYPINRNEVYKTLPSKNALQVVDSSTSGSSSPNQACLPSSSPATPRTSNQASGYTTPSVSSLRTLTPVDFQAMSSSVVDLLQKMRSNSDKKRQKKSKLVVEPGNSVLVLPENESLDNVPSTSGPITKKSKQPKKRPMSKKLKKVPTKKFKQKLKKEYSSDESISVESRESGSVDDQNFCEQMLTQIEKENKDEEELIDIIDGNIKPGVWVVIEGKSKSVKKNYIVLVVSVNKNGDPKVKFLKKQTDHVDKPYFTWRDSDGSIVDVAYVVKFLPEPNFTQRGWLLFPVSFGHEYNFQ